MASQFEILKKKKIKELQESPIICGISDSGKSLKDIDYLVQYYSYIDLVNE